MSGLVCSGCGSSDVVFEPRTRIVTCNQCGKQETYTRSSLNSSGEVLFAKENAIRFFKQGDLEEAMHYARDVLNISKDNIPALFIGGYYNEFVLGKPNAMKMVLNDICLMCDVQYDEVVDFQTLVLSAALNLVDYQTQILRFVWDNMQDPRDRQLMNSFVDKIVPYFISKEQTSEYLDEDLCDILCKIAQKFDIPNTCFMLLKSIKTIADSPYAGNNFHLQARCQCFFDTYVTRVGKVIYSMGTSSYHDKFVAAFIQVENDFKIHMEKGE